MSVAHDESGNVERDDELYRRVLYYYIASTRAISSGAFKDRRKRPLNKFSVYLAGLTSPQKCLIHVTSDFRLIGLYARTPMDLGFRVWQETEHGDNAHCNVEGESSNDVCNRLAKESYPVDVAQGG